MLIHTCERIAVIYLLSSNICCLSVARQQPIGHPGNRTARQPSAFGRFADFRSSGSVPCFHFYVYGPAKINTHLDFCLLFNKNNCISFKTVISIIVVVVSIIIIFISSSSSSSSCNELWCCIFMNSRTRETSACL